MTESDITSVRVEEFRAFNRFYTRRIGVLQEGLLQSEFSLTESRLLWELANRVRTTATELARELELDAGYLSRLLRRFRERGLVKATRATQDGRHQHLTLTAAGRKAFAPLDLRSRADLTLMLSTLAEAQQQTLLQSMHRIETLLADPGASRTAVPWLLRPHRPGDIGWIVASHGAMYAREYGWDMRFEAMVARIAADFIDRFDPAREACWIAEREGANIGSVCLVQARDDATQTVLDGVARLRLLLIDPAARGLGLGKRLVEECERFARHAGYRKIVLWTNSQLLTARAIYQRAGYRLVESKPGHSFGHDQISETWELALT